MRRATKPRSDPPRRVNCATKYRRGFTMVELLMAGTMTALTAAAGAAFISAMSNASMTTRDVRAVNSAGHFALSQIGKIIREGRAVGQVTSTTVNLWLSDTNGDDLVNLYETG